MTDKRVDANIAYMVDYRIPRARTDRSHRVWEDISLSLRAPTEVEAPIAYRITQSDSNNDTRYEIRLYDGLLWWPVLDIHDAPRAADKFVNGLAKGDYSSLGIFYPKLVPYWSSSKPTFKESFRHVEEYKVSRTSREEHFTFAQRGASETMICDAALYVLAGEPMFFGTRFPPESREISLKVGASSWREFPETGSHIPGPRADERRRALFDANVFNARNLDEATALLEQQGFSIRLANRIEILQDLNATESALDLCADAALSRLLEQKPIAAAFLDRVPGWSHPGTVSSLVSPETCRAVLRDIVERYPPDGQHDVLKDAIRCAQNVLKRLDSESALSLTDEDQDALSSLA
jgi:hypothetical protein